VADDWRYAERWPPRDAIARRYYLCGDGSLSAASSIGAPRSYVYDPRQPIPTLGGRNMLIAAGPRDQRPAQALSNYGLVYRSGPLATELTIAGEIRVSLHVESNCPDTDFVAKLIELARTAEPCCSPMALCARCTATPRWPHRSTWDRGASYA